MKISSHLISGAGNTFHITMIENISLIKPAMKTIAKEVCNRQSADGFIFLQPAADGAPGEKFKWSFYNNDGSDAEMCGNATRCVGFYIKNLLGNPLDKWELQTGAGNITIRFVEKEIYKITMTAIREIKSAQGFFCDTGVPHLVIECGEIAVGAEQKESARKLRNHVDFQPRGTNVTYVQLESDIKKAKAVSYERGVEDFTAACGTGAVAAAFYNLTKRGVRQTQVEMPGGTLMMDLSDLSKPEMTGPAVLLGSFDNAITI